MKTLQYKVIWCENVTISKVSETIFYDKLLVRNRYNTKWFGAKTKHNFVRKRYQTWCENEIYFFLRLGAKTILLRSRMMGCIEQWSKLIMESDVESLKKSQLYLLDSTTNIGQEEWVTEHGTLSMTSKSPPHPYVLSKL